jgi:hypothetical protein
MDTQKKASGKKRPVFYVITLSVPVIFFCILYLGFVTYRASHLYDYVKSNQLGGSGRTFQPDVELGFAHVPNSRGEEVFPIGPYVPFRFDGNGFRIPVEDSLPSHRRPIVLTLGGSFTEGAATEARDTYAYLVGQYLGGTSLNAAVSAYGLAQMLILGRRVVPVHTPDFLVVQYSPWLVDRALSPFAPTFYGRFPSPYFYEDSVLKIQLPVFQSIVMDLPVDRYRHKPRSLLDFASFWWNVDFRMSVHDHYNMILYELRRALRSFPKPTSDRDKVIQYVYGEFAKIAEKSHAKLIIVVLGNTYRPVQIPYSLFPPGVTVVDAHSAMLKKLPVVNDESYAAEYHHWRGSPTVDVDAHPNEKAHEIIAEEIVKTIRDFTAKKGDD